MLLKPNSNSLTSHREYGIFFSPFEWNEEDVLLSNFPFGSFTFPCGSVVPLHSFAQLFNLKFIKKQKKRKKVKLFSIQLKSNALFHVMPRHNWLKKLLFARSVKCWTLQHSLKEHRLDNTDHPFTSSSSSSYYYWFIVILYQQTLNCTELYCTVLNWTVLNCSQLNYFLAEGFCLSFCLFHSIYIPIMMVSLVFFIKSFSVTSTTALLVCRELGNKKNRVSLCLL